MVAPSFASLKKQREARKAPRFTSTSSPAPLASAPTIETPPSAEQTDQTPFPQSHTASRPALSPAIHHDHTEPNGWAHPTRDPKRSPLDSQTRTTSATDQNVNLAENPDIRVRQSQGAKAGRGLFWEPEGSRKADVCKRGTILFKVRPYPMVPSSSLFSTRCSTCFRSGLDPSPSPPSTSSTTPPAPLQRCSACKVLRYCSVECQRRDWNDHKDECKALRKYGEMMSKIKAMKLARSRGSEKKGSNGLSQPDEEEDLDGSLDDGQGSTSEPGTSVRAIARMLWARKRGRNDLWKGYEDLQSHRSSLTIDQTRPFGRLAVKLGRYLGAEALVQAMQKATEGEEDEGSKESETGNVLTKLGIRNAGELLDLVVRYATNSFTVTDSDLSPLGSCLHPASALINHSCWPNVVVVFPFGGGGTKTQSSQPMHVIAIRDIHPGEEILTAYVDIADTFETRQRLLKERYFFSCDCQVCKLSKKQAGPSDGSKVTDVTKSNWRDPREAMWCQRGCGGWINVPNCRMLTDSDTVKEVCNKCRQPSTVDLAQAIGDLDDGNRALEESELQLANQNAEAAWNACAKVLPRLTAKFAPSSHPLLGLMRNAQAALIELASTKLPAGPGEESMEVVPPTFDHDNLLAFHYFEEATRVGMLTAAGMQASTLDEKAVGGPIYPKGHPARGICLATLGKLLLVEIPPEEARGGVIARSTITNPPMVPLELKLELARQVLIQALDELEIGFGKANGGGSTGQSVREALKDLEREMMLRSAGGGNAIQIE
ncbi:SET domain-containing protein [Violaceomyces palustris]|uniref:SET domain-containing protein n=1 Tax=Violaceomyces palustris TaxID=1673888 RepID=A0ACD0P4I3_9BASI|nr:SET domain-containing protein [Violaceomyces palustris]